jgi:acyl carrier protein
MILLKKKNKKEKNIKILEKIFFRIKKKKFKKKTLIYEILDSLEILEFISEIEKKFKFKFKQEKINEKNFETLDTINNLIVDEKK